MLHLTLENRKKIASMIAHENKCVEIAEEIGCDPTTIAKAINVSPLYLLNGHSPKKHLSYYSV